MAQTAAAGDGERSASEIAGPVAGTMVDPAAVSAGAPTPGPSSEEAGREEAAATPEATAVLRWSRFLGGGATSAALSGPAGKLLVGTDSGMAVLAENTGAVACKYPASGSIGTVLNGPVYDAGTNAAVVGTSTGLVASVRANNCTVKWSKNPGLGPALVSASNDVIAATFPGGNRTIGYNRATGAVKWTIHWSYQPTDSRFSQTGFLYLGVGPFIVSVDGQTGALEWYRYFGSPITGRPAVPGNGYVYFPVDNSVYGFDAFSGDYRWDRNLGVPSQLAGMGTAANGHRLIASTTNGRVFQLNESSGATICLATLGGSFTSRGFGSGTTFEMYVTNSANGKTYKLKKNCGVAWSTVTGSSPNGSPTLVNGFLYVPSAGSLLSFQK